MQRHFIESRFSAQTITQTIAHAARLVDDAERAGALKDEAPRVHFIEKHGSELDEVRRQLNEAGKDLIRHARGDSTCRNRHCETLGLSRIEHLYESLELLLHGGRHCSERHQLLEVQWDNGLLDSGSGMRFFGMTATRHIQSRTNGELNWGNKHLLQISDALHFVLEPSASRPLPADASARGWVNGVCFADLVAAYREDPSSPLRAPRAEGHIWRQYRIHEQGVAHVESSLPTLVQPAERRVISLISEAQGERGTPVFFQSQYHIPGRGKVYLGYRSSDGKRIDFNRGKIELQVKDCLAHVAEAILSEPTLEFARNRYGRGRTQNHGLNA